LHVGDGRQETLREHAGLAAIHDERLALQPELADRGDDGRRSTPEHLVQGAVAMRRDQLLHGDRPGAPVFAGGHVGEIGEHHLHSEPLPPSLKLGAAVPADLERLIMRCLAKHPAQRVPSALDLVHDLSELSGIDAWSMDEAQGWWRANIKAGPGPRPRRSRPIGGRRAEDLVLAIDRRHR